MVDYSSRIIDICRFILGFSFPFMTRMVVLLNLLLLPKSFIFRFVRGDEFFLFEVFISGSDLREVDVFEPMLLPFKFIMYGS